MTIRSIGVTRPAWRMADAPRAGMTEVATPFASGGMGEAGVFDMP